MVLTPEGLSLEEQPAAEEVRHEIDEPERQRERGIAHHRRSYEIS